MAALELYSGNFCQTVGATGACAVISAERGGAACGRWENEERLHVRIEGASIKKEASNGTKEKTGAGEVNVSRRESEKQLIQTKIKRVMSK